MSYQYDFTWVAFDVYFWTMLEFGLGIICACAPSLRVLFKRYLSEKFSSARPSDGSGIVPPWCHRKRMRSESESELTGVGAERESYLNGIVAEKTVQLSRSRPEQQQLRTREGLHEMDVMASSPFELAEKDRSAFAASTTTDPLFAGGGTGQDNTAKPLRSPEDYELKALASLQEGRKSLLQAEARRKLSVPGFAL